MQAFISFEQRKKVNGASVVRIPKLARAVAHLAAVVSNQAKIPKNKKYAVLLLQDSVLFVLLLIKTRQM